MTINFLVNRLPDALGWNLEATVWDVAINPVYQGQGLGKLMKYILKIKKYWHLQVLIRGCRSSIFLKIKGGH